MAYTYEKTNNETLIDEGEYEVIIERMEERTLESGKQKLSLMYRIRDDVDGQKFGNKCIFEDIWKEKESPEHYNRKRLNQLMGTQEIEDGKVFEGIGDIIDTLKGCPIKLHITVEFDDYRQKDVNKVAWYRSSDYKPKALGENLKEVSNDDELPF